MMHLIDDLMIERSIFSNNKHNNSILTWMIHGEKDRGQCPRLPKE